MVADAGAMVAAILAPASKAALPEMECMGGQPVPLDWVVSVS